MQTKLVAWSFLLVGALFVRVDASRASEACENFRGGDGALAGQCAEEAIGELTDPDRYNLAVGLLDGIGEPAIPSLLRALDSKEWLQRAAAADALGRMGVRLEEPESVVNALAAHSGDPDVRVRRQVIGALARIGRKTPAADDAIRQAETDSDALVRQLATFGRQRLN